jgi:hypothetical protein
MTIDTTKRTNNSIGKGGRNMSKIFLHDWESVGAEALGLAGAKLAAYIDNMKEASICEESKTFLWNFFTLRVRE